MPQRITTNQFVSDCISVHGEVYDYTKTTYVTARDKVEIVCKDHGPFTQRAYAHKNGQGCPKCAHNFAITKEEMTKRSKHLYGERYSLDLSDFTGRKGKMKARCGLCDRWFETLVETHLNGPDGGCQNCAALKRAEGLRDSIKGKAETEWLDSLNIDDRQVDIFVRGRRFVVDGFCKKTNTIYEYYGGYWHGDPNTYDSEEYNRTTKCTFGELYQKTVDREDILKENYNIVSKWGP